MNITPLTIYLWQLADRLINSASSLAFFTAGVALILLVFRGICEIPPKDLNEEKRAMILTYSIRSILASCVFWALSIFTPSSSTIAMMVVIPEIAHSKAIQQDLPDIYNAAVEALKNQLKK